MSRHAVKINQSSQQVSETDKYPVISGEHTVDNQLHIIQYDTNRQFYKRPHERNNEKG